MIEKKTPVSKGATSSNIAGTKPATASQPVANPVVIPLFQKENYILMLIGLIIIACGMLVMGGGKSNNPAVFDQKEVYSTMRITIAPLLILIGLGMEVFAIFKKNKPAN